MRIGRANPVADSATYSYTVEDKVGVLQQLSGGVFEGNLGSPAAAGAKTLATIQTEVIAAITADLKTPPNDGVS
jgi:hypothetical protein